LGVICLVSMASSFGAAFILAALGLFLLSGSPTIVLVVEVRQRTSTLPPLDLGEERDGLVLHHGVVAVLPNESRNGTSLMAVRLTD
jgi:hypothetical protein